MLESKNEKQEFELFQTREIAFWSTNCQWSQIIERDKIIKLAIDDKIQEQIEETKQIDYVEEYKKGYALRMLQKMAETTQQ